MFGNRVREKRQAAGYTLTALARLAKMDPAQLCRLEKSGNVTLQTVAQLATALGLSISELTAGETAEPTEEPPFCQSLPVEPEPPPVSLSLSPR